ncbi:fimbria/pilus periplasmic chaperone [Hoeflea sp. WL0058]|uniref:Fimbria/pilus periplasmic chaperone n=2 Tax=Flavimaribacter sediminis TaxID=2865987 RepID=A0AAE2ZND7_9HYPH|nr:fimbria/pilus periplasmic chaperone [Flavimaribacter sediminis]
MRPFFLAAAFVLSMLFSASAVGSTLRVAPTSLDLGNGAKTASVRVWNDETDPVTIQVRVFRWTVENGKDVLEPTRDVVASPPISKLAPGTENIIRIVRVAKLPVRGRESYRLIIDQLPDPSRRQTGMINILVRHAIPVHFH